MVSEASMMMDELERRAEIIAVELLGWGWYPDAGGKRKVLAPTVKKAGEVMPQMPKTILADKRISRLFVEMKNERR